MQHGEAVGAELREIEHVPDQPLETLGLRGDHDQRGVSHLLIGDHALAQRLDVTANGRQRRAQLMRDRHQEVALELLRFGQPRRHLAEAPRELADLAAARDLRHVDVVPASGDLVCRP